MAINQDYYGSQDTWSTAHAKSKNQDFEVKIPAFNPSNSTECYSGALPYKWGSLYDESESYIVENDTSFCYIAMDKNAPQLHSIYSTITINSGDNSGHFYAKLTLSPENSVPFGWAMGTVRDYITVIGTGDYWHRAPVNYQPTWYSEDWHPTVNVYSGKTLVSYLSESAGDLYSPAPILSFPYRNIKLVPVIRAYALASGKTENDVKNAQTLSEFTSAVNRSSYCIVDLKTYLDDTYDGTPFYQEYPVIASIYAVPILLFFDENGDLAIPTGDSTSKKYHSTSEAAASWGTLNSAFYPMYFNESSTFDEIFKYDGTAYTSQDEKSCETLFFNPSKAPFSYVYYGYNGTTSPTGSLSVDTNGWGAFCIAGRAAGSANNRTDIYCRVIDNENWRTFWNTANGDCDCGNFISDYQNVSGFREYVRKVVAYFGMYFSDGVENSVEEKSTMDTAGLHLGIVDENGITHGTYTTGSQNPTAPNYDWEDPIDDTPWTPGGGDGEDSDNDEARTQLPTGWENSLYNDFYNMYYLGPGFTYALYQAIERLVNPSFWDSLMTDKIFTPQQYVISCHTMPAKLVPPASSLMERIACGATTLTDEGVIAPRFASSYKFYTVGEIDVNEALNDFNDYSLTNIYIHLPYIGFKQLDTEAVMGGRLNVSYIADVISGDCVATVWVRDRNGNSKNRYEWKGNCARPMNLTTVAEPWSNAAGIIGGIASKAAPVIISGLTGGLSLAAGAITYSSINRMANSTGLSQVSGWDTGRFIELARDRNMTLPGDSLRNVAIGLGSQKGIGSIGSMFNTSASATTSNNASGGHVSVQTETKCYLLIVRPQESRPSSYKDLFGLPSDKAGKVKDFSGFLSIRETKLDGIEATEDEKAQIIELLMSGIYI